WSLENTMMIPDKLVIVPPHAHGPAPQSPPSASALWPDARRLMATPLIDAIRQRQDLKESLTHTAQELAHLASIYGVVRVSYSYLAVKCRCSRRTVIRHIQQLLDLRILRKTVLWIRGNFCETSTYTFRIAWDTWGRRGGSDKTARKLPQRE